jgi:hypothetical protein
MSGTKSSNISGPTADQGQCEEYVDYDGNHRRCRHPATTLEDGKSWCSLHAPSTKRKRAEKKAAAAKETPVAEAKAPPSQEIVMEAEPMEPGESEEEFAPAFPPAQPSAQPPAPPVSSPMVELVDHHVREALAIAEAGVVTLIQISNFSDRGWPQTTPPENYKILLKEAATKAKAQVNNMRTRIINLRKSLNIKD